MSEEERDQIVLTPDAESYQTPEWISRLASERRIVLTALERNQWHLTRTAKELGLADHASLLKIMRRHGIERP